jgi:hypothetical protein
MNTKLLTQSPQIKAFFNFIVLKFFLGTFLFGIFCYISFLLQIIVKFSVNELDLTQTIRSFLISFPRDYYPEFMLLELPIVNLIVIFLSGCILHLFITFVSKYITVSSSNTQS